MLYSILKDAIAHNASDVHLVNKSYPILRIDGELRRFSEYGALSAETLAQMVPQLLKPESQALYASKLQVDGSYEFEGRRFRVHIYRQMGTDAFALRLIPNKIPKLEEVNLPPSIRKFTTLKNGLVLITGVTGSGKSTTLAAIIGEINETQSMHIVTVEDPIEFVHEHKKSIVNQREVASDVPTFADAVRAAVREDPDILLLGEMRDLDTIMNAITMAETGHLVFATLHTKSAAETVDRIIDVFPPNQQEQVRIQLANCLRGIVSQTLLPRIGGGRVPCCEIMMVTQAIRNLIKERAVPNNINDAIQTSRKIGSQTIYQAAADLYRNKLITLDVAHGAVEDPELLDQFIA